MKGVQDLLKIIGSRIRDEGAKYISEALKTNTSLTELDLGSDWVYGIQNFPGIWSEGD